MVRQLLSADRVIHEQQLGWQWQPPEDTLFVSPHDVVQANPAATTAAAGTAACSSSGTRVSSWAGGGASAAGSRQVSSGGGSIILGLGSPKGSPKASQAGSQHRVSGSRRGSMTSGTGSARGASTGGAAAVLQLHSPPEVRVDQACSDYLQWMSGYKAFWADGAEGLPVCGVKRTSVAAADKCSLHNFAAHSNLCHIGCQPQSAQCYCIVSRTGLLLPEIPEPAYNLAACTTFTCCVPGRSASHSASLLWRPVPAGRRSRLPGGGQDSSPDS